MAVSNEQYASLLARLTKLEHAYNDLATAINQVVTLNQVTQLTTMAQADNLALIAQVDALETRVTMIEQDPTGGL